jgi:hypothetical protein
MEGRIVTTETAESLQGVFFDSDTFFNFVQDINEVYFLFLSSSDEVDIAPTEYAYLLDIPLSEFIPKPNPPFSPTNEN